jgi:1-acyl-sn-glycerol-3-phosphate acyltransferase
MNDVENMNKNNSNDPESEYSQSAENSVNEEELGEQTSTTDRDREAMSNTDFDVEDIQRLVNDLDSLVVKLRAISPDYKPPIYHPQHLKTLLKDNLNALTPEFNSEMLESLRSSISEDVFDPDTWKGLWYMLNYYLEYQGDLIKRRFSGDYETDEWGLDPEFVEAVRPFFDFLSNKYFRVEVSGIDNVPEEGRGMLVANHSGQIPWDGTMIGNAMLNEHSAGRLIRALYASWFPKLPVLSSFLVKMGQTLANEENGIRLLEQEELVLVFPEGIKGISKLYKDRYKLARFGRGGFIRMALKTGAPIIPVSVVGAEETYITLRHARFISKLIGYPFFPISLRFPWFGLLGLIPLPTKWYIDFGTPIQIDHYDQESASDLILISQLTNQVRNIIQNMIFERLASRQSIFFG